jgi:hypothetical protein
MAEFFGTPDTSAIGFLSDRFHILLLAPFVTLGSMSFAVLIWGFAHGVGHVIARSTKRSPPRRWAWFLRFAAGGIVCGLVLCVLSLGLSGWLCDSRCPPDITWDGQNVCPNQTRLAELARMLIGWPMLAFTMLAIGESWVIAQPFYFLKYLGCRICDGGWC